VTTFALADDPEAPAEGTKKETAHEYFVRIDTDASQSLSLEEFVAGHKTEKADLAAKRFAKMDTDADGSVSVEEFKAALKARRDKRKK
ncbi:MAG TPA: EF-hand domain-containing protein, partial [Nannocystaceae bacterium]|nr:EF-hand domain-containing protein [Nannocystaceae bacterium]